MKRHTLGQIVAIDGAFRAWNPGTNAYELADPTTLKLLLQRPGGTSLEQDYGVGMVDPFIRIDTTGTGTYIAEVLPDVEGRWIWRWQPSGSVEGAGEGDFLVESMMSSALQILIPPDDFDAVRSVLGVTQLDVKDENIEAMEFGQQAEMRIRLAVIGWQDIMTTGGDGALQLRTAAVYMTAALIAGSAAKGGFIGLMQPNTQRDWDADAAMLWSKTEEWLNIAENPDGYDPAAYPLPMMAIAVREKPDTARAAPRWADGYPAQWGGMHE